MTVMQAPTLINARQSEDLDTVRRLFEMHLDPATLDNYRLPVADGTRVIVGLSGGADSSVLALFAALYLIERYQVEFIFTDTRAEPESCYDTLRQIERLTGIRIQHLSTGAGLFGLIDRYNGFLPSSQKRWCTRALKLDPLKSYIASLPAGQSYISLAGIRADEADREGIQFQYSMEMDAQAAFPFVDLGVTKTTVFDILDRSIGIPETYRYRSRSGCYSCFFQRNAELIGMLVNDPANFAHTERYEKLSRADESRWADIPTTVAQMGLGALYPVPEFVDARFAQSVPKPQPRTTRRRRNEHHQDLFGFDAASIDQTGQDVFAAFALYSDQRLADELTPGVYWQEFITVSPTLAGLKSALNNHYRFRRTTPMPHYSIEDMQIVIAQCRFPAGTLDLGSPDSDSYTWKSETAYRQLRHTVRHIQTLLNNTDLSQRYAQAQTRLAQAQDDLEELDARDAIEGLERSMGKAPSSPGKLVWEGLYTPSPETEKTVQLELEGVSVQSDFHQAREGLDHDEVPRACVMCSL